MDLLATRRSPLALFLTTGHGGIPPNIHAIVIDKNSVIYAADHDVMTVRVFDANGKNLRNIQVRWGRASTHTHHDDLRSQDHLRHRSVGFQTVN